MAEDKFNYQRDIWEPTTRDLYARGGHITSVEPRGPMPGDGYRGVKRLTLTEALNYHGACAIIYGGDVADDRDQV